MADDAERDGGHRVRQARGGPRPRRADAHPAGQSHGAREGGDEQQADPQPLNYPPPDGKQPEQLEERPHREQVADRLIQQPAELLRIPQSKRAGQKAGRVDHELELGVRDDVARRGRERDRGQEQAAREQSEPDRESLPALPPGPAPPPGYPGWLRIAQPRRRHFHHGGPVVPATSPGRGSADAAGHGTSSPELTSISSTGPSATTWTPPPSPCGTIQAPVRVPDAIPALALGRIRHSSDPGRPACLSCFGRETTQAYRIGEGADTAPLRREPAS